ncbi:hypothetical protein PROAA_1090007 [Candidatus Propionivibrio aalborgensis]|uniref:Uncharacterized protein n=1 Tax=Candidatus Propionivibrio aalborgensis TaxID=1860101 RepID=A0A1A8XH29_9RHOO|nr:hypothetical protein PROAA_1090007 [Candidatus Propionivibrio aalborgensis]
MVVGRVGTANLLGSGGGDQCVGVAGVADDQDFHILLGVLGNGFALNGEDGAVGRQEIGTFHAGAARAGADQQADVGVLECNVGVVGGDHSFEKRERAVVEFHHDTLAGFLGLRQVEQLEKDRLVFSEHFTGGDPEKQAVTDLAGSAGNGDTNWGFGHGAAPVGKDELQKNQKSTVALSVTGSFKASNTRGES